MPSGTSKCARRQRWCTRATPSSVRSHWSRSMYGHRLHWHLPHAMLESASPWSVWSPSVWHSHSHWALGRTE
eukprot:6422449-Alexandrium_andersonii.AAC.1